MAVLLSSVVQSPASPPGSVVEAVKHLLQLRADGAACAEQLDPVQMCLKSKVIPSGRRTCTCSQRCTWVPAIMQAQGALITHTGACSQWWFSQAGTFLSCACRHAKQGPSDSAHRRLQSMVVQSGRHTPVLHMCACRHAHQRPSNSAHRCLQSAVHAKQGRTDLVHICLQS